MLQELISYTETEKLLKEIASVEYEVTVLSEGVFDSFKDNFITFITKMKKIVAASNSKGHLNDVVARQWYATELEKFKLSYTKVPPSVKPHLDSLLKRHGIILSGVDVSRDNMVRLVKLRIIGMFVFLMNNMKQDQYTWLIDIAIPGLGTALGALNNAKDAKSIIQGLGNTYQQVKKLFDAA